MHPSTPPSRHRWRVAAVAALALVAGALALSSPPVGAAGGGGGAAATVPNGLSTTDLNAVGMSPATLASTLVGPGVSVSNVTFSGANAQAGTIHLVDPAVVSFNDGVILSSGDISSVVGPNKSESTTGDMAGPEDPQLTALIAGTQTVNPMTYDAASLEFDFVPTSNQVYFTYTFGSDEYLEWVNLFNDVFAFYVNGQNCATTPSGDPVSIDTINSTVNSGLYRDNSFWSPPANPINIEPDGLSVELICQANVTPGTTNHLKLAIADTSDQILDSVVMIKAHSLSTTPPESCNDSVDNDDDLLVDMEDSQCSTTTTPPPTGSSGIGSSNSGPPFTGYEGSPITLDASALGWTPTEDTLETTWTVTGINGTVGTCDIIPSTPQPKLADGSAAVVHAICPTDGEYVASIEGWDIEGGSAWDTDVDFFVQNAPPAVSIDAPTTGSTVELGAPLDLAATVVDPGVGDAVTCEISWGDGTSEPGVLDAGTCSGSHAYADAGTVLVSVTATDDQGESAAAASLVTVADTATVVTSNANPAVTGQTVTFTATTTAGTTGTMAFYDGPTLLGTKTVKAGKAALATKFAAVGAHAIRATYTSADAATTSTSAPLAQQVDPANSSTTLTGSVNPTVSGQVLVIKAAVKGVAPGSGVANGLVTLYDDGVPVSAKLAKNGVASWTVKPKVGVHHFTADFAGSDAYLPSSTTTSLVQTVVQAQSQIVITSSYPTAPYGRAGSVIVKVAPVAPSTGLPTGSVEVFDGGTSLGTFPLVSGRALLPIKSLAVGTHLLTATYGGDTEFVGSSSSVPFVQTIT